MASKIDPAVAKELKMLRKAIEKIDAARIKDTENTTKWAKAQNESTFKWAKAEIEKTRNWITKIEQPLRDKVEDNRLSIEKLKSKHY